MLEVQKWLREQNGNLELLEKQLGISNVLHDDGRVILNYSQIDSPKTNKIVRECRGLILDRFNNWNLVARSFPRFFNWGENLEDQRNFEWDRCRAEEKVDGSLIVCHHFNGEWHINTRGSFGQGLVNDFVSWRQLFELAIPPNFFSALNPEYTYIFELCSLYNKIVRSYEKPTLFLLTVFCAESEIDLKSVEDQSNFIGVQRPDVLFFSDIYDLTLYIENKSNNDPTFEGMVLVDQNNLRIKVKSPKYLVLHKLHNNGHISIDSLVNIVMYKEDDEFLVYFKELKPQFDLIKNEIAKARKEIDNLWFCYHDEPSRKKFALSVVPSKWSSFLFKAKDTGEHPIELFNKNRPLVSKILEKILTKQLESLKLGNRQKDLNAKV